VAEFKPLKLKGETKRLLKAINQALAPDATPWQQILNSIKPPAGYCALRRDRDSGEWWLDTMTYSFNSVKEVRAKLYEQDYRNAHSRAFAASNPALAIVRVNLEIAK